jgi:hypothetical protein
MSMSFDTNQPNVQEYFGIVAIVDALGVSNYTIDDCRKLLADLEEIDSQKERFIAIFNSEPKKNEWIGSRTLSNAIKNVKTSQFGDTIILAFPIEDQYNCENLTITYFVAAHLCSLIVQGLVHKIPFRGSISVGKFLWEDSNERILGPAIADANNWCNATEWFGIIFSPKANYWLSTLIEKTKTIPEGALLLTCFDNFICKYKAPLKVPLKEPPNSYDNLEYFFVVAWPSLLHYCQIKNKKNQKSEQQCGTWLFEKILSDMPKPKGTELKYKNSVEFFNWYGTVIKKSHNR